MLQQVLLNVDAMDSYSLVINDPSARIRKLNAGEHVV